MHIKIATPLFVQADHACNGKLCGVPGGASRHRSVYDHSDAHFFGTVMSHSQVHSTVAFIDGQYRSLVLALSHVADFELNLVGYEQRPLNAMLEEENKRYCKSIKKTMAESVFCRTESGFLMRNTVLLTPLMHNCNHMNIVALELTLQFLVHDSWPEKKAFLTRESEARGLYSEVNDFFSLIHAHRYLCSHVHCIITSR